MKKNFPITGVEQSYSPQANILSTTDLKGMISYINDDFVEISGFTREELLRKSHNIVRHPEMPPEAFEDLWSSVKSGNSWMGMVKNRCKNGDHYWVNAYVTPIVKNGATVEYQSVRSMPAREDVERADQLYTNLLAGRSPRCLKRPLLGMLSKMWAGVGASWLVTVLMGMFLFDLTLLPALGMFAVGVILAVIILSMQFSPLRQVIDKAKAVNDNPVARHVFTGRNDEIGQLMLAIRTLEGETGGVIGRIADSAKLLTAKAEMMISALSSTSNGVKQQFSETDQVATAVNEMSASVQEVAENAQQTASAANVASGEASAGKKIVNEAMSSIKSLADEVEQATTVIRKLEQDSSNISKIIDVIQGISEQTNLLALNAAIEAARAGEQGRGFAVVADEVRTLAGRTHSATDEIKGMIEKIQQGSQNAVAVMERGRTQAADGVKKAGDAVASLETIARAIGTINEMSTQIATAVEEQSAVAEEINRSIMTIRDISETTLQEAASTVDAAEEMSTMAVDLETLAAQFWDKRRN